MLQRHSSSAGSSRLGSDGRSLGRGSDSGAGSDKGSQLNPSERIATMYDSLAAELRDDVTKNRLFLAGGGIYGLKRIFGTSKLLVLNSIWVILVKINKFDLFVVGGGDILNYL